MDWDGHVLSEKDRNRDRSMVGTPALSGEVLEGQIDILQGR